MARGRKKGSVSFIQVTRTMKVKGKETVVLIAEYPVKSPAPLNLKDGNYTVKVIVRNINAPVASPVVEEPEA